MHKWKLWLIGCLLSTPLVYGQQLLQTSVSLQLRKADLETALLALSERSGVPIAYSRDLLPAKRISAKFRDKPLSVVLDEVLSGTGWAYRQIGRQLVLYQAPVEPPVRRFTISGFVQDYSSGEWLIGAFIRDERSGRSAVSNEYGFFSLTLPQGEAELLITQLGYNMDVYPLMLQRDTSLQILLQEVVLLTEVEIRATRETPNFSAVKVAPVETATAEQMATLGGESDIVRHLHLMPGVQTGTDGVEGFFVRGGSQGHNLVLIDGVPVYNYSHAAGLFSVFNTAAVRSVRLLTSGFPARYGGRLSSVLDIRTKEGNMRSFQGRADLGIISSRLTLEGPIWRDKMAFFISGRSAHINSFLPALSRKFKSAQGEDGETRYDFEDLNIKVHYTASARDKLYFSLYTGRDQFDNTGYRQQRLSLFDSGGNAYQFRYDRSYLEKFQWGNTVSSLRWNHVFGKKLFANTTVMFSRLDVDVNYQNVDSLILLQPQLLLGENINVGRFRSGINERGLRFDADFVPTPSHYWRFGLGVANRNFRPGALVYNERVGNSSTLANTPLQAAEMTLYVEDEFKLGKRFMGNAGLHYVNWTVRNRNYRSLQPRLAVQYQTAEYLKLRASYARMAQFLHLLTNADIGLPTDFWVPSTDKIAPEESQQYDVGLDMTLGSAFTLSLDGYYKRMDHLLSFTEGASILNDWQQNVTTGMGKAYGLEAMLSYRQVRGRAWISYGLARAERQFERINLGRVFPFKYDRRHDLKVAGVYQVNERLTLSGNWTLSSGFAYSLPLAVFSYQLPGQGGPPVVVQDFDEKNKYRMPWYHRLDVNAQLKLPSKQVEHIINVGVYNVYNRRNPLYYNLRTQFEIENNQLRENKSFVQVWLFPVMPSFSYSVQF
jgi:hypothetical protein